MNLGQLRIGARLTLSFALLLVLLLAVAGLALVRMDALSRVTEAIVQDQAARVALTQESQQHAQAAATRLLQLLVTAERDKRIPLYAAMDAENDALDKTVAALGQRLQTADKARLERLSALRQGYGDRFHETVEMIEASGVEAARDHFAAKTETALAALLAEAAALARDQQAAMTTAQQGLTAQVSEARLTVIGLSLAALALGAALAWAVTRSIVGPVREAVRVAEAIAAGDLSRRFTPRGSDEMGQLLRALAAMHASLGGLIGAIGSAAAKVQDAAGTMGSPVDQVRTGSAAQQEALSRVNRTVAAFAAQIGAVSAAAAQTREQAGQAQDLARQGCGLIADASREVEQIAATISDSANAVEALRERALSVRTLLDTVREIAEQTNLLALNASIEAARAGESGRGFAVVADEVRKLADRTGQATGEISQVIDAIDRETDVAVGRIGQGRSEMERGVALIQGIVPPLTQLSAGAQASFEQLRQLAAATDAQTRESQAIAAALGDIGGMAGDNLAAVQRVASTSGHLTTLSKALAEQVEKFVLPDQPGYR